MNVKKTLHSRVRGWFPQEPKLSGENTANSPNNITIELQDESSIVRSLWKKSAIPLLAILIAVDLLMLYLVRNDLISEKVFDSSSGFMMLVPLYYVITLNLYVRKKTHRGHILDKTVIPLMAVSMVAMLLLSYYEINHLISFDEATLSTLGIMALIFCYNLLIDSYTRSKTRKSKSTPLQSLTQINPS